MTAPCMGGWCTRRDHCANYHAASVDQQPAERLCPPGRDGAGLQPMEMIDMRHYLSAEKQDRIVAMLTPAGLPVRRIIEAIGCNAANARITVSNLAAEGKVFTVRTSTDEAKRSEVWVFPTAEARDAFAAERRAASLCRVLEYRRMQAARRKELRHAEGRSRSARSEAALKREAERRALRAAEAEMAKQRARLAREAAAAEKQRQKAEAKSQQQRLKAETKAAGQVAKPRGTASPAPVKPRGPAMLPGELDLSKARITIAPPMRDRWASDAPPRVVASNECRGWAEAAAA